MRTRETPEAILDLPVVWLLPSTLNELMTNWAGSGSWASSSSARWASSWARDIFWMVTARATFCSSGALLIVVCASAVASGGAGDPGDSVAPASVVGCSMSRGWEAAAPASRELSAAGLTGWKETPSATTTVVVAEA